MSRPALSKLVTRFPFEDEEKIQLITTIQRVCPFFPLFRKTSDFKTKKIALLCSKKIIAIIKIFENILEIKNSASFRNKSTERNVSRFYLTPVRLQNLPYRRISLYTPGRLKISNPLLITTNLSIGPLKGCTRSGSKRGRGWGEAKEGRPRYVAHLHLPYLSRFAGISMAEGRRPSNFLS